MTSLENRRIAIVGSGAVGCYYGGALARAGFDVRFLMRSDLEAVRRAGLTIHSRGEAWNIAAQVYGSSEQIGACDLVIIALKATGNDALESILPPLLGSETTLLTLQNGLGNERFLAERWGAERVLGGLCFVCLNRTAPGVIEHFDHGTLSIGEFVGRPRARTRAIVEAFRKGGIDANAVENLCEERWRKLVWNIPFNGLSIAARGATVADVLAEEGLRTLARGLMDEVLEGASRLGHPILASFADYQLERSWSMGAYKPSSLIDWELGRPVEVEAIWGEPWRQGTAAGASMRRLETIYRLLQRVARPEVAQ